MGPGAAAPDAGIAEEREEAWAAAVKPGVGLTVVLSFLNTGRPQDRLFQQRAISTENGY